MMPDEIRPALTREDVDDVRELVEEYARLIEEYESQGCANDTERETVARRRRLVQKLDALAQRDPR